MIRECVFCPDCGRAYDFSDLKMLGTIPFCPRCNYRFELSGLGETVCEACGRRIRFTPGAAGVRCVCAQEGAREASVPRKKPEGPMLMEWDEKAPLQLVWEHPRGRDLHFGDAVSVREGQAVLFTAGGKNYWLTKPDTYTLGHDDRSEKEILMAKLYGEDLSGLPPLLDTRVRFVQLSPLRFVPYVLKFLLRKIRIIVEITLKIDIQVTNTKALCLAVEEQTEKQILDSMLRDTCQERLQARLEKEVPGAGVPEAAAWLEANGAQALGDISAEKDGISVEGVHDVYVHAQTCLCPVCAQEVRYPEKACPGGHPLVWCPTCRTPADEKGVCVNRHQLVYCVYCGGFVEGRDGQCLIHRRA